MSQRNTIISAVDLAGEARIRCNALLAWLWKVSDIHLAIVQACMADLLRGESRGALKGALKQLQRSIGVLLQHSLDGLMGYPPNCRCAGCCPCLGVLSAQQVTL